MPDPTTPDVPAIESPPPAAQPAHEAPDPRRQLHQLAQELIRAKNRRLLMEYLRMRRTLR